MSLAETQQIMVMLQEIVKILDGVDVKTVKINNDLPRTKEALSTFRTLERIALRYLAIARQLGLPDDVDRVINTLTRLIVIINMLKMSINMLYMSNPATMALGIAGMATSIATLPSLMEGY